MIAYHGAMTALTFTVYALAVARATTLITEDKLTERLRNLALQWLANRRWREFDAYASHLNERIQAGGAEANKMEEATLTALSTNAEKSGYLSYLITCPWCVSMWIGFPAAFIWWNWPDAWWTLGPAAALAFSYITGKLAQIGG